MKESANGIIKKLQMKRGECYSYLELKKKQDDEQNEGEERKDCIEYDFGLVVLCGFSHDFRVILHHPHHLLRLI